MTRLLWIPAILIGLASSNAVAADEETKEPSSVLQIKAESIDSETVKLGDYQGDVLLIVNTASRCGYTPQYAGLQDIYEKYQERGFKVLAFPSNDFGRQEPGNDAQIKQFCTENYDVSFPLFSKIVVKGSDKHPLYQFLTSKQANGSFGGEIRWNFTKFLVNRKGEIVGRFEPNVDPESPQLTSAIETALDESK